MSGTVELTAADGHRFAAYRTGPSDAKAGLVVLQEIFGVNSHIRDVADAFAGQGYAVIAPALFDRIRRGVELGYTDEDVAAGIALRSQVPEAGTLADIEAAARVLGGVKTGIIGYCWGGTVPWLGATKTTTFAAAVAWYGTAIAATRTATPRCPVELHFGETDDLIPMSDVEAIRTAQPGIDVFVYPGTGHGFGCRPRDSYRPRDAALAQARTLAFFARHLR